MFEREQFDGLEMPGAREADQDEPRWGIWCTVSGGPTGHREAWLKVEGVEFETDDRAEAEALARSMSDNAAQQRYRTAHFSYEARPRSV